MNFSELVPDVQIETRSCATGVITRAIRWTVQDFCRQTHYWHHEIEPLTLLTFVPEASNTYIYRLPIPDHTRILAVANLSKSQLPLFERSPDWLNEHMPYWREASGDPRYVLMMSDRQVRFVPASDKVQPVAVTGSVILEPDDKAGECGDELARYHEALVAGTLAKLLTMRNRPWTDGARAGVCAATYQMAISEARQEAMRHWTYGDLTVRKAAWL